MLTEQFVTLFGGDDPLVRALLDWDRLLLQGSRVEEIVVVDVADLASYWTVWHVDSAGHPADYHAPDARPLTVAEAHALRKQWPARRRRTVEAFSIVLGSSAVVQLLLPSVALPDGGALLLDGTHRVLAAYGLEARVRALELRLVTELSEDLLPDLRHHLEGNPS